MSSGLFAYSPAAVVCVDGKELLVYTPADEAPAWKKTLPVAAAGVAIAGDHVLAIDARGDLFRFSADDGAETAKETFIGEPRALAGGGAGAFGVALDDTVVVVEGSARRTLAIAGAQAIGFSAKLVAVGTERGKLHIVDGESTVAEADLGAAVRGVVRHPQGFWLATVKDTVVKVTDAGEVIPFTRASGRSPSAIACSKDGAMIAVQTSSREVIVVTYPSKETLLTATYPEREAVGVAFSEDERFVWIGVDKGDANKIDLDLHDVYRTDPHPGRARTAWVLKVQIDKSVRAWVKAAKKSAQAAARVPAPAPAPRIEAVSVVGVPGDALEASEPSGPPEPELPPSTETDKRLVLGVLFAAGLAGVLSLFLGR